MFSSLAIALRPWVISAISWTRLVWRELLGRADQLQVVDHEQRQAMLALQAPGAGAQGRDRERRRIVDEQRSRREILARLHHLLEVQSRSLPRRRSSELSSAWADSRRIASCSADISSENTPTA